METNMSKLVVIDVETTGFGRHDRIVEIAALTLDPTTWETIDEFDTLINPERDVGPTGVHGIKAAMVEAAPTFSDIMPAVAGRLQGAVLIAHNLAFDRRMLQQEFDRRQFATDLGDGLCTYRCTRMKLSLACDKFDIPLSRQHRALADARATAELSRRLQLASQVHSARAASVDVVLQAANCHTLRRGLVDAGISPMHRVVSRAGLPDCDSIIQQYLDMLDWVLDDGVIDGRERSELSQLAHDLGISKHDLGYAHRAYLNCIIAAAARDGVISVAEHELIVRIADQLEIDDAVIPCVTPVANVATIPGGGRVCFSGTANKARLEALALQAGLTPVHSVTKKGCDVLVAADVATASGKARNARKWGIPLMSLEDFLEQFDER